MSESAFLFPFKVVLIPAVFLILYSLFPFSSVHSPLGWIRISNIFPGCPPRKISGVFVLISGCLKFFLFEELCFLDIYSSGLY